jgi:hypothetical protein
MWSATNVLNGMRVLFSLCIDFYFYHTYKKEWQWITLETRVEGPKSNEMEKSYWVVAINWTIGVLMKILNKNGTT